MTVTTENNISKRLSLTGDISLIQEEDSNEITTLYDNENGCDSEKEVIKYNMMFEDNDAHSSTVSPIQLKPFENFKITYDDINNNSINTYSRTTSANSQFSDNRKNSVGSSARSSYSCYNYESNAYDGKQIQLPKLRSPFKSKENSDEIDINVVNSAPKQKKRNRSLRWSYQGEIDTINEIQNQKAIIDTEKKLFANDDTDSNKDEQLRLKPIHKRTASLPYGSTLKVETSSETPSASMISLKRRLSPSTFFKTSSEDREGKIKQQQKKIKELELENLKQFSQIQELISQTSYCIKEIEILKSTTNTKRNGRFSFKNIIYLIVFALLLTVFLYEITTDSSSIFNTQKSLVHTYAIPNIDFPTESLWYTSESPTYSYLEILNKKAKYLFSYIYN